MEDLTAMEREVLRLRWDGLSNEAIADRLFRSRGAVQHIVARLRKKGVELPDRRRSAYAQAKAGGRSAPVPAPAAPSVPADLPPHPFWSPARDAAVLRCTSWVDIGNLAARWQKPVAFVTGRFLRLGGVMATRPRAGRREAAE